MSFKEGDFVICTWSKVSLFKVGEIFQVVNDGGYLSIFSRKDNRFFEIVIAHPEYITIRHLTPAMKVLYGTSSDDLGEL